MSFESYCLQSVNIMGEGRNFSILKLVRSLDGEKKPAVSIAIVHL